MKKLIINRKEWANGKSCTKLWIKSKLKINNSDRYCCLGLMCRDLFDVKDEDLQNRAFPVFNNLPEINQKLKKIGLLNNFSLTSVGEAIVRVNDNSTISEEEREESLRRYFKLIGIEVEFTGELLP